MREVELEKVCCRKCIEHQKKMFLTRYSSGNNEENAWRSGISAAVRQLKVYSFHDASKRREVREEWKRQLLKLGNKYKETQTRQQFEKDVEELKTAMNAKYKTEFTHPDLRNNNPGFRIAQAQKSLSVYLKHLWCSGKIAMPPVCPIDSTILTVIGKRGKRCTWGYINKMEEYRQQLDWVEEFVKNYKPGFSVAEWELLVF